MKTIALLIICILSTGCVNDNIVEKLSVIDYDSIHKSELTQKTDFSRVKDVEREINDLMSRGSEVNYEVLSVSINNSQNNNFKLKKINTKITSFKNITFLEVHESVNFLLSETKKGEIIDYYQSLNLFRNELYNYTKSDALMVFNIDRKTFTKGTSKNNTFSVLKGFDQNNHNALLVEIDGDKRTKYWVHYKNLFDRANSRRNYSYSTSGWFKIKKKTSQNYLAKVD